MKNVIDESDEIILESLIRSPAFTSLKKVLDQYKKTCHSELLSSTDSTRIFQIQGRLIGLNVIENLPEVIVSQRRERLKREVEKAKVEDEKNKRLGIQK